ncbi:MAG: DUF1376 domain-containing protein [Halanaerobiales bacterium]|nr:DUF1376 domain-containing protein [Halanaerobiales bacterium]
MKSPAVLFYTSDFLTGVSNLTMKERGQYITMLSLQHQQGRLSKKTLIINIGELEDISPDVLSKFIIDKDGNYYNERMEEESIKRNAYVKSRYDNGYKGGRPKNVEKNHKVNHKVKHKVKHMPNHIGNENDNEDINDNVLVNKDKEDLELDEALSYDWLNQKENNNE